MTARCVVVALAACSGSPAMPDAGACWPVAATPGGEVELGTGDTAFAPMPRTLPVIKDQTQGDPYLMINARIRGLPPGDPDDLLAPNNPRTKIEVAIPGLGWTLGVPCPARMGYVPARDTADAYDLARALHVGFGYDRPVQVADGEPAHITISVVGSNGLVATAEQTVTLSIPIKTLPGP